MKAVYLTIIAEFTALLFNDRNQTRKNSVEATLQIEHQRGKWANLKRQLAFKGLFPKVGNFLGMCSPFIGHDPHSHQDLERGYWTCGPSTGNISDESDFCVWNREKLELRQTLEMLSSGWEACGDMEKQVCGSSFFKTQGTTNLKGVFSWFYMGKALSKSQLNKRGRRLRSPSHSLIFSGKNN